MSVAVVGVVGAGREVHSGVGLAAMVVEGSTGRRLAFGWPGGSGRVVDDV